MPATKKTDYSRLYRLRQHAMNKVKGYAPSPKLRIEYLTLQFIGPLIL